MANHKGKGLHCLTFALLVIGGLNWLVYALFNWEIGMLFGEMNNTVAKVIYILVGLAAIYEVIAHKNNCKACESPMAVGDSMGGKPQA